MVVLLYENPAQRLPREPARGRCSHRRAVLRTGDKTRFSPDHNRLPHWRLRLNSSVVQSNINSGEYSITQAWHLCYYERQ